MRGADRVGIKIAPGFTVNYTFDDDPAETYTYLARSLNPLGLAYLHVGYDSGYGRGTAPAFNPIDLLRPVREGTTDASLRTCDPAAIPARMFESAARPGGARW